MQPIASRASPSDSLIAAPPRWAFWLALDWQPRPLRSNLCGCVPCARACYWRLFSNWRLIRSCRGRMSGANVLTPHFRVMLFETLHLSHHHDRRHNRAHDRDHDDDHERAFDDVPKHSEPSRLLKKSPRAGFEAGFIAIVET